jgi:hypothetical protein
MTKEDYCLLRCGKNISELVLHLIAANRTKLCDYFNCFKLLLLLLLLLALFIPVAPTLEHRASVKRFVSLQFLNLRHSLGLLGRVISPSPGRYLTQTQNKHRHPCLEGDSNPRSKRAKTVHALDRAAIVIG